MKHKELSPRRQAQNAAFQALPVALIVKPLKFMRGKVGRKGSVQRAPGWAIELAEIAARKGHGNIVRHYARQYL